MVPEVPRILATLNGDAVLRVNWNQVARLRLAVGIYDINAAGQGIVGKPWHLKTPVASSTLSALKVAVPVATLPVSGPPRCAVFAFVDRIGKKIVHRCTIVPLERWQGLAALPAAIIRL